MHAPVPSGGGTGISPTHLTSHPFARGALVGVLLRRGTGPAPAPARLLCLRSARHPVVGGCVGGALPHAGAIVRRVSSARRRCVLAPRRLARSSRLSHSSSCLRCGVSSPPSRSALSGLSPILGSGSRGVRGVHMSPSACGYLPAPALLLVGCYQPARAAPQAAHVGSGRHLNTR